MIFCKSLKRWSISCYTDRLSANQIAGKPVRISRHVITLYTKFKLKYEDSENIKADCVNTVVFNLHQIKRRAFFETPGTRKD